jgi:hypothetical protein
MASPNFVFTQPFIRGFTHQTTSVGLTDTLLLDAAVTPIRRVKVIIQNQSATAIITVRFDSVTGVGLTIQPNQNITLDNFNGHIRCISNTAATNVHIAYAVC